jgi:prophage maintenance system killer protein
MQEELNHQIQIYKAPGGSFEIQVKFEGDTLWITQAQMAELFQADRTSITKHIKNIVNSAELSEKSNVQFLHIANSDKPVKYYSLDFVIAVGYRVNSKKATQFRVWATGKLKELLLKWYSVYEKRFLETQTRLKELEQVNKLFSRVIDSKKAEGYEKDLLKIITDYTNTWFVLNQYDKGELQVQGVSKKKPSVLDYEEVKKSIAKFKQRLIEGKQAGSLFGQEVGEKFKSVLGSINQTFGSKDLYPSIEEKAAHLLYFAIKDHPFADGNKRIGSLLFLLFLVENHHLLNKKGERKINDSALTALALLIAESKPQDKEVMVRLVINLIASK